MKVRIRFARSRKAAGTRDKNRQIALTAGALMSPASLAAWLLFLWRVAAEMKLAGGFAITSGVFSHWQAWLGTAVLLQVCSRILNRYGTARDRAAL